MVFLTKTAKCQLAKIKQTGKNPHRKSIFKKTLVYLVLQPHYKKACKAVTNMSTLEA